MSLKIERAAEATPEVHDLIGELNAVLGAVYQAHQRHGLAIEQLFEPNVRFFVAWLDGLVVGCGGVAIFDDYAEVKRMYTRPVARGRGKLCCVRSRKRLLGRASRCCDSKRAPTSMGNRSLRGHGVSANGSVRPLCGNACPQHRDQPLFRKGA
jgi:hypothetical protein